MKHLISALLYIILIITYIIVRDYEMIFMALTWSAGYWKDLFKSK